MKDKGTLILIGILVLVGGVLGYAIYQSGALKSGQTAPTQVPGAPAAGTADTTTTARTLTAEEQEALNFPGPDASDEELGRFANLVNSLMIDTRTLDISGCDVNPFVIKVKHGESITIVNNDNVAHTLFHGQVTIDVPANSTKIIGIDETFGGGTGDGNLGYSCDGLQEGIIAIRVD